MHKKLTIISVVIFYLIFVTVSCNEPAKEAPIVVETVSLSNSILSMGKEKLSDYGFFVGNMANQIPADGVLPYNLNTPLFTDYAHKLRFIQLPDSQTVAFNEKEVLDFPVGTNLIKTFYYPDDFREVSKGRRLMETRVLIHDEAKGWIALPYIWNEEQTEAFLEVAGGTQNISWIHFDGSTKTVDYVVPNTNQCKGCHVLNETMSPIGPTARQLNGTITYPDSRTLNQLDYWEEKGLLTGLPASLRPYLAVWDKPETGTLDERARAYLEINCAHCHRKEGPANTSGLFLDSYETNPHTIGVNKSPVAAGRGSGGLLFDIVPGKPDESILYYRMASTDPGEMMPELGRSIVHDEGLELIRDWITTMNDVAKY